MSSVLKALLLLWTTWTVALAVKPNNPEFAQCRQIIKDYGFREHIYADLIAHSTHSLTANDLRKFEPNATEDNIIPTVNVNLLDPEHPILPNAPEMKYPEEEEFLTDDMKMLYLTLRRGDEKNWDIVGYNTLERVIHVFHMRDLWAQMVPAYNDMKKGIRQPSQQFCECLLDMENSGVMYQIRKKAFALRQPDLIYNKPWPTKRDLDEEQAQTGTQFTGPGTVNTHAMAEAALDELRSGRDKRHATHRKAPAANTATAPKPAPHTVVKRHAGMGGHDDEPSPLPEQVEITDPSQFELRKQGPAEHHATHGQPHLVDAKSWDVWRNGLMYIDDEIINNPTAFIYCALTYHKPASA